MSQPADRPAGSRPRHVIAGLVIAAVVAVSLAVALSNRDESETPRRDAATTHETASVDVEARNARVIALLSAQDRAVSARSRAAYTATWARRAASQRDATTIFTNLKALDIDRISTRYVGANAGGVGGDEGGQFSDDVWTADVDVAWRSSSEGRPDVRTSLTYTFVEQDDRVLVADVDRAPEDRTPIWLLGKLDVRRSPRTLVVATDHATAGRLDRLLRHAVHDVQRVLPDWNGDLVGYGPSSREDFEALISAAPDTYAGIAAVTTTVDGSQDPRAPVAIVVNPDVFAGLGPIGAQVVISHEATHLATGAATVTMPLWVAEGFADYVGVGAVDVPLRVSAGAAIRDIRRSGLPDRLPADAAFEAREGVEATYEESWLAFRMMAHEYGQARVVAFYQDVVRRPRALAAALRTELGITEDRLTARWRAYLRQVAGTD